MKPELRVGTSGWAYPPWRGRFYPEALPDDAMLAYYAERFPAVEVNNTFYRMPKVEVVRGWATATPETFQFVVKASQRLTHIQRLKPEDDGALDFLLRSLAPLAGRVTLYIQTPANLKADGPRVEAFLERVRAGWAAVGNGALPISFEARHASWVEDSKAREVLRARSVPLVISDEAADLPAALAGEDGVHLRLRRGLYSDEALASVVERLRGHPAQAVYVFFRHDDEATGPALAQRLSALWSGLA